MMPCVLGASKVFAVRFRDLERWDVSFFQAVPWRWPDDVIREIGYALERKQVEVDENEPRHGIPIISKISFGGQITVTEPDARDGYKGRLFWAESGDLIYSKIRVKQGSMGIVPPEIPRLAVSPEYPVYRIRERTAVPEYLALAIRSAPFMRLLDGLAHGGATKTRIPPDQFERQLIPIPERSIQQHIVRCWQQAQETAAAARRRAAEVMVKVDARFYKDLGLAAPGTHDLPKVLAVPWTRLIRWGMSYNQHAQTAVGLTQGKYPVVDLGSVLSLVQYGTSEKANTEGKGAPIVRMNNIKDGRLNLGDLKHIELSAKERSNLLLEHDDILINRTNSKELVGKCAVFHEDAEYVFASYLIRLRADPVQADPQFVSHSLNSALGRQQINAVSRQIIGQANINAEEIRAIEIPLPRVTTQRRIMERVQEGQAEADALRTEADKLAAQATTEVEEMILGTRPSK